MLCCVETMNTEDDNVNDIMTKLQRLQEVRYKRMCQWYRSSSVTDDVKGQSSRPATLANGLLHRLQHELVSLLSQDDAIFRQLLILRHSITQLKQQQLQQQQSCYCSDDEEPEDLEVSYLSSTSSIATVEDRCRRHNGRQSDYELQPFFTSNRCVTCEHNINNSEDSAISLESSNLSSLPTSLAPSPTNDIATAPVTDDIQPATFHRHNVTYPPSRTNRHSRLDSNNVIKYRMDNSLAKSRMCSVSIPSGVDGLGRTSLTQGDRGNGPMMDQQSVTSSASCKVRKTVSPLVQMLVRSRSITFLPRGALIRREESCDSGFHGSTPTTAGEIFV